MPDLSGSQSAPQVSRKGVTGRIPVKSVRSALQLLGRRERRLLGVATIFQMSLGLLDLAGIALVGVVATVMVSAVQATELPTWLEGILQTVGLANLTKSQLIGVMGLAAALALVSKTVISAYMTRKIIDFLAGQQAKVSARLARALLSRPLLDVQRWSTAEVLYALSAGTGAAVIGVLGSTVVGLAEIFLFLIVAVSLFIVDPLLTVIAGTIFGVILFFLQVVLGRKSAANARRLADAAIGTTSAVQEALLTYREASVLNRRELYVERFEKLVVISARATGGNQYILEVPKYVLETTLILSSFGLALIQFITKDLAAAAATVALFLTAGFRIIPAMLRLQAAGINIRNGAEGARSTFELADFLEWNPVSRAEPAASGLPRDRAKIKSMIAAGHGDFRPEVVVSHVSVTYRGTNDPALIDASLVIPPGDSVALVGSTGAGKSTLADVILGVIDPDSGTVTISGSTPRAAIDKWPGAMAYVPQTVALVEGTIRDNVALGLPREAIDDDRVWEALERSHLAHFLRDSREGIDTFIGERGIRLSGGQRQRLGIARALYTRPLLLVLDEATSALDAETEQAIVQTLEELEGSVTTITIAHRLATVRRADQLLYLRDGRIVAQGDFLAVRSKVPDFDRQAALLGL
jgi:ABC-type multidrug transport system fused ATPase/permease subunit